MEINRRSECTWLPPQLTKKKYNYAVTVSKGTSHIQDGLIVHKGDFYGDDKGDMTSDDIEKKAPGMLISIGGAHFWREFDPRHNAVQIQGRFHESEFSNSFE